MSLGVTEVNLEQTSIKAGESFIQRKETIPNGEGSLKAGAVLAEGFDKKFYALVKATAVAAEVIASQSGTEVTFTGKLAKRFVEPGSITIKATISSAEVQLVEDGHGRLNGDDGAGVISYGEDGDAEFSVTFDTAPDNPSDITADYEHGDANKKHVPAGVLLEDADASSADVKAQVLRFGEVRNAALIWPASITATNKAQAVAEMAKKGIYPV